jgi:hypothetical protein
VIDQRTEGRYPARAVKDFNRLAEATQIRLHLEALQGGTLLPMWNTGPDLRGLLVLELWQVFGIPGAVERLKRCSVCRKWFADETRNNSKERCSLPKADYAGTRDCV